MLKAALITWLPCNKVTTYKFKQKWNTLKGSIWKWRADYSSRSILNSRISKKVVERWACGIVTRKRFSFRIKCSWNSRHAFWLNFNNWNSLDRGGSYRQKFTIGLTITLTWSGIHLLAIKNITSDASESKNASNSLWMTKHRIKSVY